MNELSWQMKPSSQSRSRDSSRFKASKSNPERLAHLLETRTGPSAPRKSETGWTKRLKEVSEAAEKELGVQVRSARLIHVYEHTDRDAALFELESDRGMLQAILSRSGEFSFFWKH